MRLAITTSGNSPESLLDSRFGRAKGFILFTVESDHWEFIENKQNLNAVQGAGIQSAKTVLDAGAECVISGHIGPKAFQVLSGAGVAMYTASEEKSVKEIIEQYKAKELQKMEEPDVEGHW